ncbi:MAG: carboxypeptidase regulatory-like domain-containing protein [Nitrososphaerota archaeon]|nr:carboxypeptidase regulatory-like domain-containing protein [Nitrososphaerota archaeon]MDG6922643.1 carboxypeptidase regulatory-like domain-containing protein [Nitrososphaerota archaeon]
MEERTKDRLVIAAIILVLLLLMSLMAINLDRFGSPTSSNLGVGSGIPQFFSSQVGTLVVLTESNFAFASNVSQLTRFASQPLTGVYVSITDTQSGSTVSTVFSNLTNSNGNLTLRLPAGKYEVRFVDWRLNFSSVSAEVFKGRITHVEAFLNATGCSALDFTIFDPDSSNWVMGWEQLYMRVPSNVAADSTTSSLYLELDDSPLVATLEDSNLTSLIPVTNLDSLGALDSQWLLIQVAFSVPIENVSALQLLSLNVSYRVETN